MSLPHPLGPPGLRHRPWGGWAVQVTVAGTAEDANRQVVPLHPPENVARCVHWRSFDVAVPAGLKGGVLTPREVPARGRSGLRDGARRLLARCSGAGGGQGPAGWPWVFLSWFARPHREPGRRRLVWRSPGRLGVAGGAGPATAGAQPGRTWLPDAGRARPASRWWYHPDDPHGEHKGKGGTDQEVCPAFPGVSRGRYSIRGTALT
jgi:hypothetical protein